VIVKLITFFNQGAFDMKIQKCFAVKPGLDGLLDVARRTYSETVEDVQSAAACLFFFILFIFFVL